MKNKFVQSWGLLVSCLLVVLAFVAEAIFFKSGTGFALASLPIAGRFIFRNSGAAGEGGAAAEDNPELAAIKAIGDQVDSFKTMLGEKADAEQFKKLSDEIEALKTGLAELSAKEISKMLESINKENDKIYKQLVELQEEAAEAKEAPKGGKAGKVVELVTTKMVEDFINETFEGNGKGDKTHKAAKIEIKAAETFGYPQFFEGAPGTVIDAFTGRFVDPELYKRRRKRNLILDYFDIQTINVPKLIYLIKVEVGDTNTVSGDPGSAAWILSGQAKPKRSFRVTTGEAEAKKVAIFGTVEDKLLRDVGSLENWIRDDFFEEMREAINDGLLNNNPDIDSDAPLGLKTNAIQYSATPAYDGTIATPNYIDMIFAIIALFRYNKEEAETIFVSSDVHTRIMHLKDSEDRYLNNNLIYVNTQGELYIGGVHIVWADEEDVPSANVLAIGRDLGFKIKAYGNMVFERGLNGEDFRYDRTSFRAYQEFLSYIPTNRENSVMYDTWANILAAIEV